MYERYMVTPEDIKNVEKWGKVVGFDIKVKSPYYKSVPFDDIAMLHIRMDNMLFTEDDITFTIKDSTYKMHDMETLTEHRWSTNDKATIFVPLMGGIPGGTHMIEVGVGIRTNKRGVVHPTSNVCYITS